MKKNKPILLVEDDRVDTLTVKRALKELKVLNPLDIVNNGEEAWLFCEMKVTNIPALFFWT